MKIFFYIIILVVILAVLMFVIGLCLPKERVHSHTSVYNATPKQVFDIVTDNVNWQYRGDIKDLKVISTEGNKQVWDEYGTDGSVIRFTTTSYEPYSFYAFNMRSNIFNGYWESTYIETANGGTTYTATEHLTINNPFIRAMNRMFFNLDKYMAGQQVAIGNEINKRYGTKD